MNNEEIMKQFNETFSDVRIEEKKKEEMPTTPYRVTSNENNIPTNLTNVNTPSNIPPLGNVGYVNNVESNVINNNEQPMPENNNNNQNQYGSNVNYNYVPTQPTSVNKKTVTFKMPKEFMPIVVIVIILLVAILIIPTVYDIFTGL